MKATRESTEYENYNYPIVFQNFNRFANHYFFRLMKFNLLIEIRGSLLTIKIRIRNFYLYAIKVHSFAFHL